MTVKVGSQCYPLIEHDGSLFADEERAFLFQMLDNNTAVVAGEQTSVTYSLAGFTKAYNHVAKICDFYRQTPQRFYKPQAQS